MRDDLIKYQDSKHILFILQMHHYMRKLGLVTEVGALERGLLDEAVKGWGGKNSLIETLYLAAGVGLHTSIGENEKALMLGELEVARKQKNGWGISVDHHFLRELGIATEVTGEDEKQMQKMLEEARRIGNETYVAGIHYNARRLAGTRPAEAHDMPPLRRFTR